MDHFDDYSPIADQGELDAPAGFFGLLTKKRELPVVGGGFRLVLIDKHGKPISSDDRPTAGEKRFAGARSWVKVDVGAHMLDHTVPFRDPTGHAGLRAAVSVRCSVVDPYAIAEKALESVGRLVHTALGEAIARIASDVTASPEQSADPVAALAEARRSAEQRLRQALVGKSCALAEPGIAAEVESVSVSFDDATEKYYDQLISGVRGDTVRGAERGREASETAHTLALRAQWRDALRPFLSDPATRAFEVVFADPSRENIASVVDHLNSTEEGMREQVFHVLSSLIEKDHLHKTSELPAAMDAIIGSLQRQRPSLSAPEPGPAAIEAGVTEEHEDPQEVVDSESESH